MSGERVDSRGDRPRRRRRNRGLPRARQPDPIGLRSAPAAGLAALAEAGVIFLPLRLTAVQGLHANGGPLASYPAFVLLFAGGTVLAVRYHRSWLMAPAVTTAAFAMGLFQAIAFGRGDMASIAIAVLLSLAAGLRVVTLALRDWRNPVDASFGWGAVLLLVEIVAASSTRAGWEGLLPLIVPVFFVASLGSRAASARIAAGRSTGFVVSRRDAVGGAAAEPSPRMSLGLLGGLVSAIVVAGLLGGRGGLFERVGSVVFTAIVWGIVGASVVLGLIGTVLAWLAKLVHLDIAAGLQRVASNLGRARTRLHPSRAPSNLTWVGRTLGALVFAGAVYLIVRAINRRRARPEWEEARLSGRAQIEQLEREAVGSPRRAARTRGRTQPRAAVRRWYADALRLLRSRGLRKPAGITPREYVGIVAHVFPEARHGFAELTRAYEEVRYGSFVLDRDRLRRVQGQRAAAAAVIRRAKRADLEDEGPSDEESEMVAKYGRAGPRHGGAVGGVAGPMPGHEGDL